MTGTSLDEYGNTFGPRIYVSLLWKVQDDATYTTNIEQHLLAMAWM